VRLSRVIGGRALPDLDPFLLFDEFRSDDASDYIGGFPDHPHRGFETVTYMLAGRMRHGDNKGNSGLLVPGSVQWMTAGRGIVHSEMPEQSEGLMRGFQLWVNLPSTKKMSAPAYQEHPAASMPIEEREGGVRVKVIAGETSRGTRGPVTAESTQARYFDVEVPAGASFVETIPADHAAFVVVYDGAAQFGTQSIEAIGLAQLGAGDAVEFSAVAKGVRALVIAGHPLNEPVAWHGPFVMNTQQEIVQAVQDYQAGRF
jgi:redox-sensitive bicupin YhaK (pirin superfamily)